MVKECIYKGSERHPTAITDAFIPQTSMKLNTSKKLILDQTAFMQELSPMAHEVFSTNVRSLRPKVSVYRINRRICIQGL